MSVRHLSIFRFAGVLGVLLALLSANLLGAVEPLAHFEQANRLYEQGKFAEAASLYESMAKAGRHSAALFFNLGNAYFKQGELGRALFNYRWAERLSPRDPDIQANLRFVREQVDGGISISAPFWKRILRYFTLNEITLASVILFWIWAALACTVRLRPELRSKLRGVGLAFGSLLGAAVLILALSYVVHKEKAAIIAVKQATVHLGPLAESQTAFTAAAGSELTILAEREGWLQVADRSNRSGWVATTNVLVF